MSLDSDPITGAGSIQEFDSASELDTRILSIEWGVPTTPATMAGQSTPPCQGAPVSE